LSLFAPDAARADENMLRLPQEVQGWNADGEDKVFTRQTIFDYMDGGGEIYLAYDFQRLLTREYARENAPRIVAEVYQMASSGDAYGIFTHDTDGQPVSVGQSALYSPGLLRFWKHRFFVRLQAEDEAEGKGRPDVTGKPTGLRNSARGQETCAARGPAAARLARIQRSLLSYVRPTEYSLFSR